MRLLSIVVGVVLVMAVRPAAACGFWSMTDAEKGVTIGYLINSAEIKKGKRRVGAFYLDIESKRGMRVVRGHKVVFEIAGGKLKKLGKVVGTVDASGVTIGKQTYAIELADPHPTHDMPSWKLTVRRGDDVIVEGADASALCAGMHRDPPMTDAQQQEEVRRRVIFYLAWRELGAG